jgi:hypothetical protein
MNKSKPYRSPILSELLKSTPLETRLRRAIESYFISKHGGCFLIPVDEQGEPIQEAMEANERCFELAQPLVELVLKNVAQWKADGKPEKQ